MNPCKNEISSEKLKNIESFDNCNRREITINIHRSKLARKAKPVELIQHKKKNEY